MLLMPTVWHARVGQAGSRPAATEQGADLRPGLAGGTKVRVEGVDPLASEMLLGGEHLRSKHVALAEDDEVRCPEGKCPERKRILFSIL